MRLPLLVSAVKIQELSLLQKQSLVQTHPSILMFSPKPSSWIRMWWNIFSQNSGGITIRPIFNIHEAVAYFEQSLTCFHHYLVILVWSKIKRLLMHLCWCNPPCMVLLDLLCYYSLVQIKIKSQLLSRSHWNHPLEDTLIKILELVMWIYAKQQTVSQID